MTKHVLVSVKDSAAQTFGPPFMVPHPGVAVRGFQNEVNRPDEKNPTFTNPEHFELYVIGYFDDETGLLTHVVKEGVFMPELLINGLNAKRTVN